MNIDLKAQTQSLLNTNHGQELGTSSNQPASSSGLPVFGQLLSSQVRVFQEQDAKNTVNTAQLLSPKIEQASKIEAKEEARQLNHAGQATRNSDWIDPGKSAYGASAQALANSQNQVLNSRAELAYAKLAEMQAQANNMRSLSKGTSLISSGVDERFEFSILNARQLNASIAFGKAGTLGDANKDANSLKSIPNNDSEAITALGVSMSEQPGNRQHGQGGDAQSGADEPIKMRTNSLQGQIHASFGSLQWSEEISQKLVFMISANMHCAVLNLNPENLGPLKILISVQDQLVNSTFVSNSADVRQGLHDGMETLRASMEKSGLVLGQVDIRSAKTFHESQDQILASLKSEQADELAQLISDSDNQNRAPSPDGIVNVFV
jgi:flagellar hook-length control protein FliK